MSGLGFDDAVSRHIDALYRTDDAARRRRAVLDAATPAPGERVLDVGCGPGFLAAELADAVGPAGRVVGIDTSEPMLALARRRCGDRPWTEVQSGDASRLALADGGVDLAVSVQVHEYVPDVDRGLAEMARVLRPGGRAVIVATDWPSIVWHSRDAARMARVLAAFAAHCAHQDLPRTLGPRLRAVGLEVTGEDVLPQFNPAWDPACYSFHLSGLVQSFAAGRDGVTEADAAAWAEDLCRLGAEGRYFFCLNQYLFVAAKPAR